MRQAWIALAILVSGCVTKLPRIEGRIAVIQLVSSNRVMVQGRRTAIIRAGSALKSAGANQATYIEVRLSGQVEQGTVRNLKKALSRSGLRNVSVVARINVSSDGVVSVGGTSIRIAAVGRSLKAMGAGPDARIEIHGDRKASATTLKDVANRIIAAGYPKVIVARKKPPSILVKVGD